jgi:hypothetical protein
MSLHLFRPPTPAHPSSGGTERVRTDPPESGRPSGPNPHTQEMRRSIIAARVANILHLAACELYGTDQRLFEALRSSEKAILIQLASDVLQDLTPEKCWHCGTWLQHDMNDFCSTQCRLAQERG